jgi:flavin-dependent dehydrogenase
MVKPIVVIGGGLAGGAVATELARAGHAVTVLERETGPHEKVCGEFLSVEACQDLERLGLSPEQLGGVPIDRVRVHHGRTTIESHLPFLARGLSRAILDEALLDLATGAGAQVERGVRVTGATPGSVTASDGERPAERVLLATGKHDLRGHARTAPATREGYVGFKMHWRLSGRALGELGSAIELVLLGHGYGGLQRVGTREANLCLVVSRNRFAELGSTWEALLADLLDHPMLARRLADAEPLFARPLAIANLPYGYLHAAEDQAAEQVWRLGDQAAMTASLTGDGMAVALRSARLAAHAIESGAGAAAFHRMLRTHTGGQVRNAMRLQRLSEHPLALQLGMFVGRFWPGLLAIGARHTRLPPLVV